MRSTLDTTESANTPLRALALGRTYSRSEEMSLAPSIGDDGSEEATLASSAAADLARGTDSELHLVCVAPVSCKVYEMTERELSGEDLPGGPERAAEETAESRLQDLLRKIGEAGAQIVGTHARV